MAEIMEALAAAPVESLWSIEETTTDLNRAWLQGADAYANRALEAFAAAYLTVDVVFGKSGAGLRCGVIADDDVTERARRLSLLADRQLSDPARRAALIGVLWGRGTFTVDHGFASVAEAADIALRLGGRLFALPGGAVEFSLDRPFVDPIMIDQQEGWPRRTFALRWGFSSRRNPSFEEDMRAHIEVNGTRLPSGAIVLDSQEHSA
ncbi:hypothetical protein [Sphingomonas sanxanigenens]|uniref:Uncharacterized protein n=1 Tax=Sphingomonas sanxanigenens DSM 19645 = NX02 TaxID=1123269 RepID=W0ACR2_9SPHN|nr:hypothetical protein [Sphingomonas sanxanigenens]AHE55684.1 hypothetical protein NX02_20125 [Sphingomonas sanxanigenens DSM 19645 = NX02]